MDRQKAFAGAVHDMVHNKMSLRKAASKWGVKRSTLSDRVTGKVEMGRRSGPPPILTSAEEQKLAEWIINMGQRGFGVNAIMPQIRIRNAVIKGYHFFQIRAPQGLPLPVTKEYGNVRDPYALLIWLPELDEIDPTMHNIETDEKRHLKLHQVAGLVMGHVPFILSEGIVNAWRANWPQMLHVM
ncbi:uncharacterized protein [Ptychodera flava]|uniref:uncharacterized protein n=1 Tax=Ptychodera flava TaxID=63121 RepID=UPI00396A2D1E